MSWKRLIRAIVILPFVLYFEASMQLPLHLHQLTCTLWNLGRKITFLFFLKKMPIQQLSLHTEVHLTLKNGWLPLVFFLDFNNPWYDLHSHFLKKKILPLVTTVLKAEWLTPLLTIRLNLKPHVKWNAFDGRAVIKIANWITLFTYPKKH